MYLGPVTRTTVWIALYSMFPSYDILEEFIKLAVIGSTYNVELFEYLGYAAEGYREEFFCEPSAPPSFYPQLSRRLCLMTHRLCKLAVVNT